MLCYLPSSLPFLAISSCDFHCLCSGHTRYFSDLWGHLLSWVAPCSNLSSSIPALHEAAIICVVSYGLPAVPEPEESPALCCLYCFPSCSYPYSFPSLCGYALVYQLLLFQHIPKQPSFDLHSLRGSKPGIRSLKDNLPSYWHPSLL